MQILLFDWCIRKPLRLLEVDATGSGTDNPQALRLSLIGTTK
ncbi:hypothetical protein CEV33_1515 [Brucella grignonensis]|uniref:Uncharacterized protein n=1 Tax=Brucella grignonensis TaxID=94627 RepID=A0A256FAS8_9HYPH|nr:hypothetical protein CEV33_1515 [Brucella grignonensis]